MLFNRWHKQAGLQFCLEMQGITAFTLCVRYIYYILILVDYFNHLFIWLDPEVVAHDALIATKVGYLNFPLDC
jgi:hypothetical protein